MNKIYHFHFGLGTSKYAISYYDGVSTHRDGSKFYGIYLFRNKRKFHQKINALKKEGYTEQPFSL